MQAGTTPCAAPFTVFWEVVTLRMRLCLRPWSLLLSFLLTRLAGDGAAKEQLSEQKDDDDNSAPSAVKHGIDHISKALQAAQAAESTMEDDDDEEHRETAADLHKKKMIEAKMKVCAAADSQ